MIGYITKESPKRFWAEQENTNSIYGNLRKLYYETIVRVVTNRVLVWLVLPYLLFVMTER
jgi:hypothetical protein